MNDQQWFNRVALLAGVLVVVGGGFALIAGAPAPVAAPPSASADYLYLTIAFNPVTGMDEYFPANFSVPVGVPVVVTITNYDNGTNLISPTFGQVAGVFGNEATVWSNGSSIPVTYASQPITNVAHTFTIQQTGEHLNVPVPPAGPTGLPTVVEFTTEFNVTGEFTWMCMAPCDSTSMQTPGLMAGTVDVH